MCSSRTTFRASSTSIRAATAATLQPVIVEDYSTWSLPELRAELAALTPKERIILKTVFTGTLNLSESAQLDGQALLVGAINKIEIWNPGRFEQAVTANAAQFGDYTSQIFR